MHMTRRRPYPLDDRESNIMPNSAVNASIDEGLFRIRLDPIMKPKIKTNEHL